jgi:hypothetical protein
LLFPGIKPKTGKIGKLIDQLVIYLHGTNVKD